MYTMGRPILLIEESETAMGTGGYFTGMQLGTRKGEKKADSKRDGFGGMRDAHLLTERL